jgi:predicted GIY-YIG superfamily endonuclease
MSLAAAATSNLSAATRGRRGARHSIYVALLEDRAKACRWGLYVGQTASDPDLRFDQHKAGYKASRWVRRFGVRLLPELVTHLNPMLGWEALELEAGVAEELRRKGVSWVAGGH